jgi:endogenous inhibitor of DNA gyrase (YacG/DUF329 family)
MPAKIRCPGCGKKSLWEGNRWRPFCSERCKMSDLGAWVTGGYTIPGDPEEDTGHDDARNDDSEDQ